MSKNNFTKLEPTAGDDKTVNCRDAEWVEIHINGLSGGDTIAVSRALNEDATFLTWELLDANLSNAGSTFTAAGIYQTEGGAWLKFTKTGSASDAKIHIRSHISS